MNFKKSLKVLVVISVLLSCSASKTVLLPVSQNEVDLVKSKYPDYTLNNLQEGKTLYEQKCSTCHGLKKVTSHDEEQWNEIVPWMTKKANKKKPQITTEQEDLILKYLVTMSVSNQVTSPTK